MVVAVMVSTYIVMGVLSPNLQRYREIAAMDSAKNVLLSADRAIRELLHEAPKGKRIVTLQAPEGKFRIFPEADLIQFAISLNSRALDPGAGAREEALLILCSPYVTSGEQDLNDDGFPDYVLSNDVLAFGIRKLHDQTSPGSLNLSEEGFLTLINAANVGASPIFRVYINGMDSSAGIGYTQLVTHGSLEEGIAKVVVNATSGYNYELYFFLFGSQDYVRAYLRSLNASVINVTLELELNVGGIANDEVCVGGSIVSGGSYSGDELTRYFVSVQDSTLSNSSFGLIFVGAKFISLATASGSTSYVVNLTQAYKDNEFLLLVSQIACAELNQTLPPNHQIYFPLAKLSNATSCNGVIDLRYKDVDLVGIEDTELNNFGLVLERAESQGVPKVIVRRR